MIIKGEEISSMSRSKATSINNRSTITITKGETMITKAKEEVLTFIKIVSSKDEEDITIILIITIRIKLIMDREEEVVVQTIEAVEASKIINTGKTIMHTIVLIRDRDFEII